MFDHMYVYDVMGVKRIIAYFALTAWTVAVPTCKEDCEGIADGYYQSCNSCDVYVECFYG